MGYPRYVPIPEVDEYIKRIQILIKLTGIAIGIRTSPWNGRWFSLSDRPFHMSYYDKTGRYRTICYSSPEKLEVGCLRIIEELS